MGWVQVTNSSRHASTIMADFDPSTTEKEPGEIKGVRKARHDFIGHKENTQKESTARAYEFPTKNFAAHCEDHGVTVTGNITQRLVTTWLDKRQKEVKPITVKNNAKHIRVFLKWLGSRDLCDWDIHEKIEIPNVPDQGDVNQDVLRVELAEQSLEFLETYHYGSVYHALFLTMWRTGCRISGALALDLDDFDTHAYEDSVLQFRNRKETGTPLKNGHNGERDVTIDDDLSQVLNDYINGRREDIEENDREPLFTVPSGRMYRQRAYKNIVAFTRPCVSGEECPHNRTIDDCEAAQDKEQAPSCPSSASLHPVRKGAITHHINEGWPKEPLSERVDVSVDVLEKHYDFRTNEKKRENRRKYMS